jgi:hypothetical protein
MTEEKSSDCQPDKLRAIAVELALRTGLLRKCPLHGDVYDPGQHDYQGAFMLAAYLINQSDPLVVPFGGVRQPLTDLLKSICQTHACGCPRCSLSSGNGSPCATASVSRPVHNPNPESL